MTPQAMSFKKLSCLNKGILFYSMKGFALGLALNQEAKANLEMNYLHICDA